MMSSYSARLPEKSSSSQQHIDIAEGFGDGALKSLFLMLIAVGVLTACATPEVVQTRQARDNEMTFAQLKGAYADAT
jgi:hypothetical protein